MTEARFSRILIWPKGPKMCQGSPAVTVPAAANKRAAPTGETLHGALGFYN